MLTYPGAGAIVDEDVFPADKKLADEEIIGSGPYKLSQYKAGDQAVLEINDELHRRQRPARPPQVFVKYYSEPSALKLAVENGEVDVAWRSLSPTDIADLKGNGERHGRRPATAPRSATGSGGRRTGRQGAGHPAGRRPDLRPRGDRQERLRRHGRPAVLDRAARLRRPDRRVQGRLRRARRRRRRSRRSTTPASDAGQPHARLDADALRPDTVDEANEVKRQLEDSGLFNVKLKSTEWEQYQTIYKEGAYDLCILGWFPDYPDADDYLSAFLVDGGFFQNGYHNDEVNQLVAHELGTDDQAGARTSSKLQDIAAEDVPFIPTLGRARTSRSTVTDGRRRGDARPGVHLPVLDGQKTSERLAARGSWGGTRAVSPHDRVRWRPIRMSAFASGSLPRYILQRLLLVIPMIWVILLTLVFLLLRVAPGDPVSAALGGQARRRGARRSGARRSASTSR